MPSPFSETYLPSQGRSVAALRSTSYWVGSSSSRHSWSLLTTFSVFSMSLLSDRVPDTLRGPHGGASPSAPPGTLTSGGLSPASRPNRVAYPHSGDQIVPDTRYVFITGGVVSSLGKGIAAA